MDKQLESAYDIIVADSSCMPFQLEKPQTMDGLPDHQTASFADWLAYWVSQKLSESGTAMIVTDACFHSDKNRRAIWDNLEQLDTYVRACINLPAGSFHRGFTNSYLVVFDHNKRENIFVGNW